ncbi:hypothetical protein K3495_g9853 [Podosphaera aphanis]|nr:hypothetical protein K3495_g9853 [Podosphaera aphanis]
MNSPQALHHSLLRPCILHILRATGYHSTRPSVLDTLTDLTARYLALLAQTTATYASLNHAEPALVLDVTIQNVRMAMQNCGTLGPEAMLEEQDYAGVEDTRGVDDFIAWATGPVALEIRRIALEGNDENYLTILKRKQCTTGDEEAKYAGTILGREAEPRAVKVEGSGITDFKEIRESLWMSKGDTTNTYTPQRQSSVLSFAEDVTMENVEC